MESDSENGLDTSGSTDSYSYDQDDTGSIGTGSFDVSPTKLSSNHCPDRSGVEDDYGPDDKDASDADSDTTVEQIEADQEKTEKSEDLEQDPVESVEVAELFDVSNEPKGTSEAGGKDLVHEQGSEGVDSENLMHGDINMSKKFKAASKRKKVVASSDAVTKIINKRKKKTKIQVHEGVGNVTESGEMTAGRPVSQEPLNLKLPGGMSSSHVQSSTSVVYDGCTETAVSEDQTSERVVSVPVDGQSLLTDFNVSSLLDSNHLTREKLGAGSPRKHIPKPHICECCNFITNRRSHLVRHMRIHTGEKPYKCNFCDYVGKQPIDLTRHIMRHTGEKPFKCSMCNYECSQKSNLTRHVRIHTGEKPYKCDVCQFFTSQKGSLLRHMRSHSGAKVYKLKCGYCEYVTNSESHLSKHVKCHTDDLNEADMAEILGDSTGIIDNDSHSGGSSS